MHPTFLISRRFDPTYSLLGRWMRHLVPDRRRAEAYYFVLLCGIGLTLLLTQYLAWALLHPVFSGTPSDAASTFWLLQIGSFVGCSLACVLGFKPAITIMCRAEALHLMQGTTTSRLPYTAIQSIEPVSAQRYHQHYRRYAATRSFVNRIEPTLLLLHTEAGPFAIGLAPMDHVALTAHLEARLAPAYATAASAA